MSTIASLFSCEAEDILWEKIKPTGFRMNFKWSWSNMTKDIKVVWHHCPEFATTSWKVQPIFATVTHIHPWYKPHTSLSASLKGTKEAKPRAPRFKLIFQMAVWPPQPAGVAGQASLRAQAERQECDGGFVLHRTSHEQWLHLWWWKCSYFNF